MKGLIVALVYLLSNTNLLSYGTKREMCDVKMWYLEILSSGILGADLNEKQGKVKSTIEKLIGSKKGNLKLECDILETYEQILTGSDGEDGIENEDPITAEDGPKHSKEHNVKQKQGKRRGDDDTKNEDIDDPTEIDPTELDEQDMEDETVGDIVDDVGDEEKIGKGENEDEPFEDTKTEEDVEEKVEKTDDNSDDGKKLTDLKKASEDQVETEKEDDILLEEEKQSDTKVTSTDDQETIEADRPDQKEFKHNNTEESQNNADNNVGLKDKITTEHDIARKPNLVQNALCFKGNVCAISESLFAHIAPLDLTGKRKITDPIENITIETVAKSKRDTIETVEESKKDTIETVEEATEPSKTNHTESSSNTIGNKTNLNVKEVEQLLAQRRVEYTHKIQDIELQLLKLENRLLTETIGKQNNTASYTRLENLILRLENELLKINRSFSVIQEENNLLKSKQLSEKQIFEIFNKAREENSAETQKYLALAGNSTELESMVDKQQNKIVELVVMMHNQTDFINKLEEKSQRLEDQNRELHTVLVKQANMMAELVQGMNYMKAEQDKLKTTVAQPLPLTTQETKSKEKSQNPEDQSANTNPPKVEDENPKDSNEADDKLDKTKGEDEPKLHEPDMLTPNDNPQIVSENTIEALENEHVNNGEKTPEVHDEPPKQKVKQTQEEVKQPQEVNVPQATKPKKSAKKAVVIPETPKYFKPDTTRPKDCYDHFTSGKRKRDMAMRVNVGPDGKETQVFCDMKNGGWTVLMRRSEGSVDFFKDWEQYKNGFGGVLGEHWLGNDIIHYMTNQKNYRLRVELTDWERKTAWAEYDFFMVDDESNSYMLHVTGFNSESPAGDGLLKHNGMKFSTKDVDNDMATKDFDGSCARRFNGAWWYYKCYKSNLTGKYYREGTIAEGMYDGVSWKAWRPATVSLKKVEMKIMPRDK